MSLIGPRPQTNECFDAFSTSAKQQLVTVRPGLSGVGSIIFRSEEKMLSSSSTSENAKSTVGQIMRYKGELEAGMWRTSRLAFIFC